MSQLLFLRQIFRDLKSQKVRTFLTLFGIFWGTASVVLLLAFGKGLHSHFQASAHGLGEYIVIMWPGKTSQSYQGFNKGRQILFKAEDVSLLKKEIKEIKWASPEYSRWRIKIKNGKNEFLTNLTGVNPEFAFLRNEVPDKGGRFINDLDMAFRRRVVFLGTDLKKDLFKDEDPLGKYVYINNIPFLVIGVLKKKEQDSSYSGRDVNKAFVPATTMATMFNIQYLNNMVYKAVDPRLTEYVKKKVYQVLGRKYVFNPEDKEALAIWDTTEMEKFFFYLFMGMRVFFGLVGALTLIAGGIGVSNIMNVVVEERTKEIGIKMATGAKKRFILFQFIFETLTITFMGGVLGFLFAWLIVSVFPYLKLDQYVGNPQISFSVAFISIITLGLTGLFSSLVPARKAANLNPIEALRS